MLIVVPLPADAEREAFSRASDARPRGSLVPASPLARADRFAQGASRLLHGLHDVLIAGAPAQVAGEALANVGFAGRRVVSQQRVRRQQHPWRAVSALQAMLIPEPLLERVQPASVGQPLDGENLVAVGLHREHRAGLYRPLAVHDDNAAAAARRIAADVRAGQPAVFAQ